jgi:hypothetical protein
MERQVVHSFVSCHSPCPGFANQRKIQKNVCVMNMFKLPHKQTSKEGAKVMKVLEKVILSKANTMGPFTMVKHN